MKNFILPIILFFQVYVHAQTNHHESFESVYEKEFGQKLDDSNLRPIVVELEQNAAIRNKFIREFKKLPPSARKEKHSFIRFFNFMRTDSLKPFYLYLLQDESNENFFHSILPRIQAYNDPIFNQPLIDFVKNSMKTYGGRVSINGSLINGIEKALSDTNGDALNRLEEVVMVRKNNIYSQIWALKTRYYKDKEGTEAILKRKFPGYDLKEVFANPNKVIKRGRAGTELVLVLALHKHGLSDVRMLEALANSGNEYLSREAKRHAVFNSSAEGRFARWGRQ